MVYTYSDEGTGHEFSAVVGSTFNFMIPNTHYQSGIDMHLELSASQYVTQSVSVGLAGYFYNQITADRARAQPWGRSCPGRKAGPQLEYDFALGGRPSSLSAKGYYDSPARIDRKAERLLTLAIALGPLGQKATRHR